MNIRSQGLFSRPRAAALALAVSVVAMGASAARAQLFNWDRALPPAQVERMIQGIGYRLTGPVIRHGPVYLANVLGRRNDPERLIIDAREGRVLQRFAAPPRQADADGGWWGPPRQESDSLFGWLSGNDVPDSPTPPAGLDSGAEDQPARLAPVRPPAVKKLARTDDSAVPHVIMAPIGTPGATTSAPLLEKPRPRPEVRRRKFEATPVAQPAAPPGGASPAAPHVAQSKAAPPPATVAVAPVAPPAAPKAPAAKPAVNDVPVAPLE